MKKINIILVLFLIVVAAYAVSRARLDRWNIWGFGDAQILNAAIHFADEGLTKHFFLPYYRPGYLGMGGRNESKIGYYTHYQSFSAIITAMGIKVFGENRFPLRCIAILFPLTALLLWFKLISGLLDKRTALVAVIFMGTTIAFLDYMDSFSPQTYDEFFVFSAILAFMAADRKKSAALLALAWLFTFIQSLNSYDFIIFLQVFFIGYFLVIKREKPYPYLKSAFLLTAPFAGYSLHFTQVALAIGFKGAIADQSGILVAVSPARPSISEMILRMDAMFKSVDAVMGWEIGFSLLALLLMFVIYVFVNYEITSPLSAARNDSPALPRISPLRLLILFGLGPLLWWMAVPRQAGPSMISHIRQSLPFVSLLFSLTVISCWDFFRKADEKRILRYAALAAFAGLILAPAWNTLKYVRKFPNGDMLMRLWAPTTLEKVYSNIELSKKIKQNTKYGNLIFVPGNFMWDGRGMPEEMKQEPNNIYEYFSQRRMVYIGDNAVEFKTRLGKFSLYYKNEIPKFDKSASPEGLKILALVEKKDKYDYCGEFEMNKHILSRYPGKIALSDNWYLIPLN